MNFVHVSVLLNEAVEGLQPRAGGRYIDCTLGGGGHSNEILVRSNPDGNLLGLDADADAIAAATERLHEFINTGRCILVQTNFDNLEQTARANGFVPVDGILFDLGISSWHVDALERGFSFTSPTLDMRFNRHSTQASAADMVNTLEETALADLIWRYGEEPHSRSIARAITRQRSNAPITSASTLADLIRRVAGGQHGGVHPATRTFQALRIAVNRELDILPGALEQAIRLLAPGGRLVVITFHSLEDRIVKQTLRSAAESGMLSLVNRHVITPSQSELTRNRRARSAKLRIAERVRDGQTQPERIRRARIRWRGGMAKNDVEA